jgi:hypothetical protein
MTPILDQDTGFHLLASDAQIERTVKALEANKMHAVVAADGAEAKRKLFAILPEHAEVFISSSVTMDTLGVTEEINTSGRFDSVRVKLGKLDRKTQNREMQKLGATPEYMLGSIHALTETGTAIIASFSGSQLTGYAAGAAHVIWVVGTQKIVPTLEDGMKRIKEYCLPLVDARLFQSTGIHSAMNKLLIVHKEIMPGRITVILVKENIGF